MPILKITATKIPQELSTGKRMAPQYLPASPPSSPSSHVSWSFELKGKSPPYQTQGGCLHLMAVNAVGLEINTRLSEILTED